MTRKDEIRQAKSKYAEENPIYEWVECEEDYFLNEEKVSVIFEAGAEWADKTMIEKVCEWLKDNLCFYVHTVKVCGVDCPAVSTESLINDIKKEMEK